MTHHFIYDLWEDEQLGSALDTSNPNGFVPQTTQPYDQDPISTSNKKLSGTNVAGGGDPAPDPFNRDPGLDDQPIAPDMPQDKPNQNFESWRNGFFRELTTGNTPKLIQMLQNVRADNLEPYQRKFVEDNLQVQFLRQQANITKASDAIRKNIRDELDPNNPSVSMINYMVNELQNTPELLQVFLKLYGLYGIKGDLHRKFIASLFCAAQVGTGASNEDLVYNTKKYSVKISTRFANKFGSIELGKWTLKANDAEEYLSSSELEMLTSGAPQERDILRKRVIIESMASNFKKRAYVINSVDEDGTIYFMGFDLSNSLRDGYDQGKLNVKIFQDESSPASINAKGEIVELYNVSIVYQKETPEVDRSGMPIYEEHSFIHQVDDQLILTADRETLKQAAFSIQGINFKTIPYQGNPSDVSKIMQCVPSAPEILMRNC
jgi:hypothetical protein